MLMKLTAVWPASQEELRAPAIYFEPYSDESKLIFNTISLPFFKEVLINDQSHFLLNLIYLYRDRVCYACDRSSDVQSFCSDWNRTQINLSLNQSIQCPLLNRITLGLQKSDNNNRMIQLTDVLCVLLRYSGTSNIWLQYAADSIIRDPIKRRALSNKNYIYIMKKWSILLSENCLFFSFIQNQWQGYFWELT